MDFASAVLRVISPQVRRLGGLLLEGGANVFLNGRGGRSIFVHEGRRSCWSSADSWHHIFEYERKRVEHSSTRLLECGGLVEGARCVRLQPIWMLPTVKSETNSRLPLPIQTMRVLEKVFRLSLTPFRSSTSLHLPFGASYSIELDSTKTSVSGRWKGASNGKGQHCAQRTGLAKTELKRVICMDFKLLRQGAPPMHWSWIFSFC